MNARSTRNKGSDGVAAPVWGRHANVSGLIYGALVTGTVIAVASVGMDSAVAIVVDVAQVLVVYWTAHVYIRVLADRLAAPAARFVERLREAFAHELAVLLGGLPALAVFVVASVAGADPSGAANVAMAATVVLLGSAGYAIGRQAGVRGAALLGEVVGSSLLGLLVVGLKTTLHG